MFPSQSKLFLNDINDDTKSKYCYKNNKADTLFKVQERKKKSQRE